MSAAVASRWGKGPPKFHRSRRVRITEVARYSRWMTVPGSTHAEIAIVGIRTPERSKRKPISPAGAAGSGGAAGGGGTWSKVPPCSSNVTRSKVFDQFAPPALED